MNFRLLSQYHADIKNLIKISLPILLAQIAQNSMGLADTIMAGRVSSTDMSHFYWCFNLDAIDAFWARFIVGIAAYNFLFEWFRPTPSHCPSSSPRHLACVRREYSFRFADLFL